MNKKEYLQQIIRKEFDRLYKEKSIFVDEEKSNILIEIAEDSNLDEYFIKEMKNDSNHPF